MPTPDSLATGSEQTAWPRLSLLTEEGTEIGCEIESTTQETDVVAGGGRGEETGGVEIVHGAEDLVDLGIINQYQQNTVRNLQNSNSVKAVHKNTQSNKRQENERSV